MHNASHILPKSASVHRSLARADSSNKYSLDPNTERKLEETRRGNAIDREELKEEQRTFAMITGKLSIALGASQVTLVACATCPSPDGIVGRYLVRV